MAKIKKKSTRIKAHDNWPKYMVLTCEHRKYAVQAKSQEDAYRIIEEADLSPRDKRIELIEFGDFEITNPDYEEA